MVVVQHPYPRLRAYGATVSVFVALLSVTGCSTFNRSLVFFTNTTIGAEVSMDAAQGTSPVKVLAGYKRQEGTLNPVYDKAGLKTGTAAGNDKYREKAYSVIAKIQSGTGGSGGQDAGVKLSAAQWFATGEAAVLLAKAPGIAGAVTGNSKIAEAAAKESALLRDDSIPDYVKTSALVTAFDFVASVQSPEAQGILGRLNGFAMGYKNPTFVAYFDNGQGEIGHDPKRTALPANDYMLITQYQGALETSIDAIETLLADGSYKEIGQANRPDATRVQALLGERDDQRALLEKFEKTLRNESSVKDALAYLGRIAMAEEEE